MSGRCLCGAVSYSGQLKNGPEFGVCHCRMCQRWGGGAGLATEMVELFIDGKAHLKWFASSDWAKRGFCKTCGSNLFYQLNDHPDLYFVMVGSLDTPGELRLSEHIFIDEKPAHYDFADTAPRLTGAEFLARLTGNSQ